MRNMSFKSKASNEKRESASLVVQGSANPKCHASFELQDMPRPTIRTIVGCTARQFGLTQEQMDYRTRIVDILLPRSIAMWLAYRVFQYTSTEVGRYLGGRHHTTVLNAANRVDRQRIKDPAIDNYIQYIMAEIERNSQTKPDNRTPKWRSDNLARPQLTERQCAILCQNVGAEGVEIPTVPYSHVVGESMAAPVASPLRSRALEEHHSLTELLNLLRLYVRARLSKEKARSGKPRIDATGQERLAFQNLLNAYERFTQAAD